MISPFLGFITLLLFFLIKPTEPGKVFGPFSRHFSRKPRLSFVTFSGKVIFLAIDSGIPISFNSIIGSGVITLLPDISTLLDKRLPRILPILGTLPRNLCPNV